MGALHGKTVLLVTHQVDFLPTFDSVLVSYLCNPVFYDNFEILAIFATELNLQKITQTSLIKHYVYGLIGLGYVY